jgi:hypothetical protein
MKTRVTRAAIGLALALLPAASFAGELNSQYGGNNVAAILLAEHDTLLTATGLHLQEVGPIQPDDDLIGNQNNKFRSKLGAELNGRTLAYTEYRPPSQLQGEPTHKIHAVSGPSIETLVNREMSRTRPGSSDDELEGKATPENVQRDVAETEYYPPETEYEIRAKNFTPIPGNKVHTREVNGKLPNFADAEVKVAARIEEGLKDGTLARGGRFDMYVSKEVCTSCEENLRDIATEYDVDIDVYELAAADTESARPFFREARAAGRDLFEVRKVQTKYMFQDVAKGEVRLGSWSSSMRRVERLERELEDLRICH